MASPSASRSAPRLDRAGPGQLRHPSAVREADQARRGPPSGSRRVRRRAAGGGARSLDRSARSRPAGAARNGPGPDPSRAARPLLRRPADRSGTRFRDAPAAKHYHQAYRHGLLEHTLSVAQAVSAAASFFPGIDRDVAITGALLHDIGKIEAYNDNPLAIDLTDAGRLEGEIPLGYYTGAPRDRGIDGFDPGPGAGRPPHHPLPPRARSSTARRSSPPPARPTSST